MIKSKSGKVIAIAMLFLNLFVSVPAIAETYIPQDPGSIHDDLTGNYGVLGIASQFHVFSRGKTTINAHTNGNIATKELDANNNFGTDITSGDLQLEINYVQTTDSLIGSSLTSENDKRVNKFVVGETVTTGAENDKAVINGSRIDHLTLEEFYQDRSGQTYIDFASEFSQLANISDFMMTLAPTQTVTSSDFPDMNNRTIILTGKSNSNFISANIDAAVLQNNTPLNISNPENKVVVLNVINAPANFTVQSQIRYNGRNNQETEDFSDANLSWNFGTSLTNLAINAPFQGTIIAPNTDVTVNQNMDGTIIGNNVVLNASTNRWDPNEIFPIDDPDHSDPTTSTTDTTSESTTDPSTSESTSESTTEPSTSESTSESTTEPSTSDSTSESTTEPSTSESTSESTTEPSTSESTSESTTDPNTSDSTSESTTEPSTSESTSESTTEPSTSESTSESTTEPSTSETTSESTTEPSTSETTSESTTEPSTSESTSESTTEPSTSETTSESTTEPSTSETTSESTTDPSTSETTSESTTEPSTSESTSESTTDPSTSESTSESTTEPSTSDSTSESTTDPSTSESTSESTTEPSTSETTSESTTDPSTSEVPETSNTPDSTMHRHSDGGSVPVIAGQDSSTSNTATEILADSGSNSTESMNQTQNNNNDSTTLPKTNSISNRWLAAVGIIVILAVSGYLIYRRKKF